MCNKPNPIAVKNGLGPDADLEDEESSEGEPEDEVGELLNPELAGQIMTTISSIKSKNPKIYDPGRSFFDEKDLDRQEKEWKKKKKELKEKEAKKLTLKDYHRKRITGEIEESDSDDDIPVAKSEEAKKRNFCYDEEQEQVRCELREAFCGVPADDGEFLTVKEKSQVEIDQEDAQYRNFLLEKMAEGGCRIESWGEYTGVDTKDPNEQFLLDYVLNRGWIDHNQGPSAKFHSDSEENDYSEVEEFERKYNFRYEDPEGGAIVTHSRNLDGLVRRPDDRRIKKRKRRSEKKKDELSKRSEKIKRYKSLKKKEIIERLKLVQKFTDIPLEKLKSIDLEGDFDAEKFDKQMTSVFDEEYYSKEEDLDSGVNEFGTNIVTEDPGGSDQEPLKSRPQKRRRIKTSGRLDVKELSKYSFKDAIDELMNMDYEDVIAGQTTRFKYTRTTANSYGLTPEDIINYDDKLLSGIVPIKKLAPYRRPEVVNREEKAITRKVLYMKKKKLNMPAYAPT